MSFTPIEALQNCILAAVCASAKYPVGGIVKRMPFDEREALRDLTSDMTAAQRPDLCWPTQR